MGVSIAIQIIKATVEAQLPLLFVLPDQLVRRNSVTH